MADFGAGLGKIIGGNMAANDLENGVSNVQSAGNTINSTADAYLMRSQPYNYFGQSFLGPTTGAINDISSKAGNVQGYDQFMSTYQNTPAAQYQLQQADATTNNSAAAKGGLLSGANLRALQTVNNGIVSQNANKAYEEYLTGNNQQFGQLETALGNMFNAIGVGTTAMGQQGAVTGAQFGANANIASSEAGLAAAQAKNDQSKGSGIGDLFGGIASMATTF